MPLISRTAPVPIDVLASPRPRPDAVLEPRQRGVLGLTARHEGSKAIECLEPEVSSPGAGAAAPIALYEVNRPAVTVVAEIQHGSGHEHSIGRMTVGMIDFPSRMRG